MDFVCLAVGPVVDLAFATRLVPFVARLAFRAGVIYLVQAVSDEFLGAADALVGVLHVTFLAFVALVVALVLAILYFRDAEGLLVQSG